ncbi:hypothetical protein A4R44_08831 [Amycolatopsis sp. M39]|nr:MULTISPECIES: hypothetical protein [Amycolatopsis]OAP20407.1 hypothetical protein A4R44_08831 [Amycolatopsis sp. M39]
MTSQHHGTEPARNADLDAARLLLDRMGLTPQDLLDTPAAKPLLPTFAHYIPVVDAAVAVGTRRVYGSYWNRILDRWGDRRLDEPTPTDTKHFLEDAKTNVVARRNARGGRSAGEHLIAALRCLYKHAEDDGLITTTDNPARKVPKPARLPSTRRAVANDQLAQIEAHVVEPDVTGESRIDELSAADEGGTVEPGKAAKGDTVKIRVEVAKGSSGESDIACEDRAAEAGAGERRALEEGIAEEGRTAELGTAAEDRVVEYCAVLERRIIEPGETDASRVEKRRRPGEGRAAEAGVADQADSQPEVDQVGVGEVEVRPVRPAVPVIEVAGEDVLGREPDFPFLHPLLVFFDLSVVGPGRRSGDRWCEGHPQVGADDVDDALPLAGLSWARRSKAYSPASRTGASAEPSCSAALA